MSLPPGVKKNRQRPAKSILSRADLLLIKDQCSDESLVELAATLGYQQQLTGQASGRATDGNKKTAAIKKRSSTPPPPNQAEQPFVDPAFYRIIQYQQLVPEDVSTELQTLARVPALDLHARHQGDAPLYTPLIAWAKLWPFLKAVLGQPRATARLDAQRLTAMLANQLPLQKLPYIKHNGWAQYCHLIVDYSAASAPFRQDYNQLRQYVSHWRGGAGELQIFIMQEGPQQGCRAAGQHSAPLKPYQLPAAELPVFILSDLGCFDPAAITRHHWLKLGQRFQAAGLRPVVLMPSQRALQDTALRQFYTLLCWDQARQLPTKMPCQSATLNAAIRAPAEGLEQLLIMLSVFIIVEPALLRALRNLLPVQQVDVDTEAMLWGHPDVVSNAVECAIKVEAIQGYRRQFKTLGRALQLAVGQLIQSHHGHLPDVIRFEEQATYFDLMADKHVGAPKLQQAVADYQQQIAATLYQRRDDLASAAGLTAFVHRHGLRQNASIWHSPWLRVAWALSHEKHLKQGPVSLPPGLSLGQVQAVTADTSQGLLYNIRQRGNRLVISAFAQPPGAYKEPAQPAVMASLYLAGHLLQVSQQEGQQLQSYAIELSPGQNTEIPLPATQQLTLSGADTAFTLAPFSKPGWAQSVGFDRNGLFATLVYEHIVQKFRWINPGNFMMGSPETELARVDNREQQHPVQITAGFWLADTACTQALWQAVMAENPSKFKGPQRPVEMISWDDSQQFLLQLNEQFENLLARLPTEAEWEYACRAGTQGPFSFGDNITSEQVNYDGNYPYGGGEKGDYRQETVAVKSMPANPWGLYEMHGNVWEWCADWYQEKYQQDNTINPTGPKAGQSRVLRGGSWLRLGEHARSANRSYSTPDLRDNNFGFRLALGHKL